MSTVRSCSPKKPKHSPRTKPKLCIRIKPKRCSRPICSRCNSKPCSCKSESENENEIQNNPANTNTNAANPTFNPTINVNPVTSTPSQNIQLAFSESRTIMTPIVNGTPILTIPPFTTTGQIVKLDSMADVFLQTLGGGDFQFSLSYILLRDGMQIALTEEADIAFDSITLTPNITWVDVPAPGTHTYQVVVNITGAVSELRDRALTAILFPPSSVLPSTIT